MATPDRPGPGRVPRPSADPTRDRILAAAADAFAEHGFSGARTREIATRAGVAQPLLNYHFRSKDQLWRAAVDSLFEALASAMRAHEEQLDELDERARAKALVRAFVVFSARHPQLHRIITQESQVDGERLAHLVEHHVQAMYDDTVALFERLVADGVVADIGLPHLFYVLTGAGPSMFVLAPQCRQLTGLDPTTDEVVEAHADAVCTLLFGRA